MISLASLRQFSVPREFRIGAGAFGDKDMARLEELAEALRNITVTKPPPAIRPKFVAELATGVWRTRDKMRQPGTERPLPEMSRAFRHVESVWATLEREGIRILDHTGEPVEGREIKVLAFEPHPGIAREMVIQTVSPTVYLGETRVQTGEVIAGTPVQG